MERVFTAVRSEDVDWKPFPAFPPSVRLAVVVGQPSEAGLYTPEQTAGVCAGCRCRASGNTFHFHWAKSGEYVTQISAIGPLGIEYLNSTDDPRTHVG